MARFITIMALKNIILKHIFMMSLLNVARWPRVASEDTEDLGSTPFIDLPTTEVEAVVGKSVALPCDIEPDSNEDRVYMVLWFRHSGGKPLYSFDVRGRGFSKALQWSDPFSFSSRAYFVTMTRPAALVVQDVQLDDEGTYRCRVDFKNSPTRNFQIRLKVIVQPHQIILYDEDNRSIAGIVGPIEEGDNITLLCEIRGGRPQPSVKWMFNNTQISKYTIIHDDGKVIVSQITLFNAQRNWHNGLIRCRANNTNLIMPPERTARIQMYLKPDTVVILNKPRVIYSDRETTLICVAHGSRPSATIVWYRDKWRFYESMQNETVNETTTISRLIMNTTYEDDGRTIRCRAENPLLTVAVEDTFKMNVYYKPVVNLTLGSSLNAHEIKLGDDVYFECIIKSNPKELRINWYHNDFSINKDHSIFVSTKILVLRKVNRTEGGLYSCAVTNEMGETFSPEMYLRIQFTPICDQSSPKIIGARMDELLRIRCIVHGEPAYVNFTWKFNNSGESFEVSPHRYGPAFLVSAGGMASELRYQASSERDYGTLFCSSTNKLGAQKNPCVFHVVPAEIPSPPRNCTTMKIPRRSEPLLAIRCLAGYNGGLRQFFTLESTGRPELLFVNTSAAFRDGHPPDAEVWLNVSWSLLEDLNEEQNLRITAHNVKGSSEPVMIYGLIYNDPNKKIEEEKKSVTETKVPVIVALIVLVALIIFTSATAAYLFKKPPERTIRATSSVPTKRPSQSVVQMDSQGCRTLIAYPTTSEKDEKSDILLPQQENIPLRVVLEANGDSHVVREVRPVGAPPLPDDVVRRRKKDFQTFFLNLRETAV